MGTEAVLRAAIGEARRVVVKVGSSSLTGPGGGAIDDARLVALVDHLAAVRARGGEVVLVSSGAIAAGLGPMGLSTRPRDLATQQAAASVGQGALVAAYARAFARHHLTVGQVLLTADDMTRRTHYTNARRTLTKLLDLGIVPIVNENDTVATHEIRFGDNDRLAALVSHLVGADALVLLTDVDALYDGPPTRAGSSRISAVLKPEDLAGIEIGGTGSSVGSGGMATKVESAGIAGAAGIPAVLSRLADAGRALAGEDVGTVFAPQVRSKASRALWIAHATTPRGRLVVDDGAVTALTKRRTSLLPAGIVGVHGTFTGGDPVDVCGPDGSAIARGLVNYSSGELPAMLGRSTHDLARDLGAAYEREVIHRDDLVLL
ncbi:gamma-glutamyl kinase [Knoellia sinensis KCTC 19936]|uniref:Glutamate 5-kinase n=1 Tax=Knoellia sinensis KCTC 19936 TaxID=1385520 RepID=A0A0A0J2V3_9MICO|nr:glutamate 5-kinase [Knoellia sinensis]KGN29966.1 gamma-glutamyl kinase [Knoellia sinensis KCTC 19936]